jgi:hypothetical protein
MVGCRRTRGEAEVTAAGVVFGMDAVVLGTDGVVLESLGELRPDRVGRLA